MMTRRRLALVLLCLFATAPCAGVGQQDADCESNGSAWVLSVSCFEGGSVPSASPVCCQLLLRIVDQGGFRCLCLIAALPDMIVSGHTAEDLIRSYQRCGGRRAVNLSDIKFTCSDAASASTATPTPIGVASHAREEELPETPPSSDTEQEQPAKQRQKQRTNSASLSSQEQEKEQEQPPAHQQALAPGSQWPWQVELGVIVVGGVLVLVFMLLVFCCCLKISGQLGYFFAYVLEMIRRVAQFVATVNEAHREIAMGMIQAPVPQQDGRALPRAH